MKNTYILILLTLTLMGCEKFDLPRDNPLDNNVDTQNNEPPTPASIEYKSYEITSDDNDDDFITKGETIGLKVYLKNTGGTTANLVKATFQTSNQYVSILSTSYDVSYGNITANSVADGHYY